MTLIAVGWQVHEMIKVYGPIQAQADAATKSIENAERALVQAQRAWVGPRNASFAAEPAVDKPIEITIQYENSGHEPALGFIYGVEPIGILESDETLASKLTDFQTQCREKKQWNGGGVVYPTAGATFGSSGYSLFAKTRDDFVDDVTIKGDRIIIVHGCFWYRTFAMPKYSYFCYFYKQGFSKIQNLNICPIGQEGD
jgi:hypothetical protein